VTRPSLASLTFEERIRLAAGCRVDSIEERIVSRELERLRPPDPTGDDWLRAARGGQSPTLDERRAAAPNEAVDRDAAVREFDEQVIEVARELRPTRRRRQRQLRGRYR
jgi:hypothetical protein